MRLDAQRYRYAVVGLKDDTMGELIPPGSLVEVDVTQNEVQEFGWNSIRDRPVYPVWHNDGHTCCWCQLESKDGLACCQQTGSITSARHPCYIRPPRKALLDKANG
jgi:hypothetical protein